MKADGTAIESCVHITMPSNALMADIHNTRNNLHRMPAIVNAEDRDASPSGTAEEARAVLTQYPADLMPAFEVSTQVNSVKNNGPGLIEPVQREARLFA